MTDHETHDKIPLSVSVCGTPVVQRAGIWYTHHSFGRILAELADRVTHICYQGPGLENDNGALDFPLTYDNISVIPWFPRRNSLQALRKPWRLFTDYAHAPKRGDVLFLRGSHPLMWAAHWFARLRGRGVVHWLVGNPVAILRAEQRGYGRLLQRLGLLFAQFEERMLRLSIGFSRAHILANGVEVADIYRSPRTTPVVSSSITADDFRQRDDTCTNDQIRLVFVGFIRPEKGIEYLIRALPNISSDRPVTLALVGPHGQFATEKPRLDNLINELGLADRVTWEGYAAFGEQLFGQIDRSDILVLPTLSEGTPRVLVEARARSVPIVSTTVGGIPTSVTDGHDGLLVPPRDPQALADAISRIINDADFRQRIIKAGRERVADWTVERFVDRVVNCLALAANYQPSSAPER